MRLVAVNWYDERLDEYYGHDNQGFVYWHNMCMVLDVVRLDARCK